MSKLEGFSHQESTLSASSNRSPIETCEGCWHRLVLFFGLVPQQIQDVVHVVHLYLRIVLALVSNACPVWRPFGAGLSSQVTPWKQLVGFLERGVLLSWPCGFLERRTHTKTTSWY